MNSRLWFQTTVFWGYTVQYLKGKLAYRLDFFLEAFTEVFHHAANLLIILVLFSQVELLKGYSKEQLIFIYGFFLIPYGMFSAFFGNLYQLPEKYILQGELDRVLIRPINKLLQVIMETMTLEDLAGSVVGLLLMVFMGFKLGINFTLGDIPMLILLSVGAVLIYGGLFIIITSTGFWVEGSLTIIPILYNLSSYGRYPINIFRGFIRFVLTWIVPFAFVGFYPAAYFLRLTEFRNYSYLTPVIGLIFFTLSYLVWLRGLHRYQGTGS
jgi:ABC-2 type transport system permease protein